MKRSFSCLLSLFLLLNSELSFSQSRNNYWPLGYQSFTTDTLVGGMTIDFPNNSRNVYLHERGMWFQFANASICDSSGNLLFYTNGVYIANTQDDTMLNGSGLNPSGYTTTWFNYGLRIQQADIIIPKPGSDSLFYLFHETIDSWNIFRPQFASPPSLPTPKK